MTAMMEYLFYHQTGKTLKLSEKYMAHSLLRLMIDEFYDQEKKIYLQKPDLGAGFAPYMIETVSRFGFLPQADYPWGQFDLAEGTRTIDLDLFDRVFVKPERDYTPAEYIEKLNEAFLAPPPQRIHLTIQRINFQTGKEEAVLIRTPKELAELAAAEKSRFTVLHNRDVNPTYQHYGPKEVQEALEQLNAAASKTRTNAQTVSGETLLEAILTSLRSRMVVYIGADVWFGSWKERLVYEAGGGHGMVIVGYQQRDGETYLKLRNSWGPTIGVEGYNFVRASDLLPNTYYVMIYR